MSCEQNLAETQSRVYPWSVSSVAAELADQNLPPSFMKHVALLRKEGDKFG